MNRLKFVGTSQAPATRPIPVRMTSAGVAQDADAHYDDLAALMAELSDADPTFAELLSEAGRELAPLARSLEAARIDGTGKMKDCA